ncbi:MAG: GGDEF domain-containing protein [Candidatus Devosia symbiotica]|nr:GGDEF domain-containing protein [Candidatus Devosia symbiotica]
MTDLANRRLFQRHAEAVIAHAARNDELVVLAVLDIDHFKQFNDRFCHTIGDQALRQVAHAIASVARRPMDMATKFGEEEFALLLHGSDLPRAVPILEALRGKIAALDLPVLADAKLLTISIGAESLETIYDQANRLLYAAKANGRDRISTD